MKQNANKTLSFIRRNAVYLVLTFCVLAIGLATTLALIGGNDEQVEVPDDNPPVVQPTPDEEDEEKPSVDTQNPTQDPEDNQPVVTIITFLMPVENPTSIENYSDTMVWNGTLNRFSTHKAIDFFADEGTSVFAVYDGVVLDVSNDLLKGVTVTIDHGNGLKTVYNSLADADDISVGTSVKKGDVIGYVSSSNRQESSSGTHLHFEVIENDSIIDPAKYLTIEEK